MKASASTIDSYVDQLLMVLDEDIRHIQDTLLQLDELRGLVIKRDDAGLSRLLGAIRAKADCYAANESKRQSLRRDLAKAFGWDVAQTTLSRLETALPDDKRAQVADKKTELRMLTNKLKKEHLSTAMLLSECARFNNLLLKSIFDLGKTGTVTYRANGATSRQTDKTLINLHF
jgi:hypothetical protein